MIEQSLYMKNDKLALLKAYIGKEFSESPFPLGRWLKRVAKPASKPDTSPFKLPKEALLGGG